MVVEAGPYLGADLFALLPYTYGGWPYHNGLDALLGPYYRCSLYFNTASFPVPLRNFMSGWWEEFYSWNLPHLGKLGLFWKKTHEAWDLVFPRIATDFPGLVPLELGPDTLNTLGDRLISLKSETDYLEEEIDALRNQVMSLEEELSYTSRYRTWFKWGCIAGAVWGGISIYNLFGRKKYSQSAIYRLKRL
jgi:hypothetical protein